MKTSMIYLLIVMLAAAKPNDSLTGRWQTRPSEKGNVTGVVFKPDYSFEGYINRKPFVSGTYSLQDSIFSFVDNGCEGIRGVYKVIFFSNEDSVKFEPIMDSCNQRREGMSRLIMGRVKQ